MSEKTSVWRILTATMLLEIVMIALAFLWVALYSYLIAPGAEATAYQSYARQASPIVSLVAGPFVFGAASLLFWRSRRELGQREMWWTLVLYLLLDIVIVFVAAQDLGKNLLLWVPNALTKSLGVWLAPRIAGK